MFACMCISYVTFSTSVPSRRFGCCCSSGVRLACRTGGRGATPADHTRKISPSQVAKDRAAKHAVAGRVLGGPAGYYPAANTTPSSPRTAAAAPPDATTATPSPLGGVHAARASDTTCHGPTGIPPGPASAEFKNGAAVSGHHGGYFCGGRSSICGSSWQCACLTAAAATGSAAGEDQRTDRFCPRY